jgi:hypothetical protein
MDGCLRCGLRLIDHADAAVDHAFVDDRPCGQCLVEQATLGDRFCSDYCRDEYDRQIAGTDDESDEGGEQ